jgi:hypothetical protein
MSCVSPAPGVLVCGVRSGPHMRTLRPCPTEDGRIRRMVYTYSGLFFGPDLTCLGCGERWSDEGQYPRPFRRGWREEAMATARQAWRMALPVEQYRAFTQAQLDAYMEAS